MVTLFAVRSLIISNKTDFETIGGKLVTIQLIFSISEKNLEHHLNSLNTGSVPNLNPNTHD